MEKYSEFIKECDKEIEARNMNNYYRITLSDKMSNLIKKFQEVTKRKCPEQYERVQSFIKVNNVDGKPVIAEGKEAEVQRAFQDLMQCQGPSSQLFVGIQGINKITETIVLEQLGLCINDCVNINNEDEAKKCIKTCYKSTYDYTLTACHKFMEQTLGGIEEQINKL
jgi:hypothetical protein